MVLIIAGLHTGAQPRGLESNITLEHLRELNLSAAQRARIMAIIRRQRLEYYLNRRELNEILTEDQKKKLQKWKQRPAASSDSTSNHKPLQDAKNS